MLAYFKETKQVKISPLIDDDFIKEIISVLIYMALQWANGYSLATTQDLLEMVARNGETIIRLDEVPKFPQSPAPWSSYENWTLVDVDWYILWAQVIEFIYRSATRNPEKQGNLKKKDTNERNVDYKRLLLAMDKDILLCLQWREHLTRQGFSSCEPRFVQSIEDPDHLTFLITEESETKNSQILSEKEAKDIGWYRGSKSKGRFWCYRQCDIDGKRPELYFMVTVDEEVIGIWTTNGSFHCDDIPWPDLSITIEDKERTAKDFEGASKLVKNSGSKLSERMSYDVSA